MNTLNLCCGFPFSQSSRTGNFATCTSTSNSSGRVVMSVLMLSDRLGVCAKWMGDLTTRVGEEASGWSDHYHTTKKL